MTTPLIDLIEIVRNDSVRLTLPLPGNFSNTETKKTLWVYKKARDAYTARAMVAIQNQLVPKRNFTNADCVARMFVHQLMDEDNLTARLKWPFDALRATSLIIDDKPKHLRLFALPTQVVDRVEQRVQLVLWERRDWMRRPPEMIAAAVFSSAVVSS